MKRLLILGGSEFQIPLIKRAKELGYYIGVVDVDDNSPACEYADKKYKGSLKDKEKVLGFAKEFEPDGITAGMVDIAVPTCAYIAAQLNLPGIDEDTAKRATDKYEMIKAFAASNVPHPWFVFVSQNEIACKKIDVEFPAIVKPVDMAGSRGIFLVNDKEELYQAISNSSQVSDKGDVIVEEYMDGPEVSVELVVKDGIPYVIQVTDKMTSGAPYFAEVGHIQPSQLNADVIEKIKEVACDAARALNLKNSLGHAEIKVTSNGPKMVEIGARAGGDGIAEQLIELSTGVSFSEMAIQIAMGEVVDIPEIIETRASCIRFILSHDGVLKSIDGVEEANSIENIKEIKMFGKIGQKYKEMVDNSGRIGYVIAGADNVKKAKESCDKALEFIKTIYE